MKAVLRHLLRVNAHRHSPDNIDEAKNLREDKCNYCKHENHILVWCACLETELVEGGSLELGNLELRERSRAAARVQVESHARLAAPSSPTPLLLRRLRRPGRLQTIENG